MLPCVQEASEMQMLFFSCHGSIHVSLVWGLSALQLMQKVMLEKVTQDFLLLLNMGKNSTVEGHLLFCQRFTYRSIQTIFGVLSPMCEVYMVQLLWHIYCRPSPGNYELQSSLTLSRSLHPLQASPVYGRRGLSGYPTTQTHRHTHLHHGCLPARLKGWSQWQKEI